MFIYLVYQMQTHASVVKGITLHRQRAVYSQLYLQSTSDKQKASNIALPVAT